MPSRLGAFRCFCGWQSAFQKHAPRAKFTKAILTKAPPGWILTGVDDVFPTAFWFGHGYPNPFNPTARVRFAVPSPARVRIALYNIAGREVRVLLDEETEPGYHTVAVDAEGLPSGVYFCRMVSGAFVEDRKLVLLK